MVFETSKVLLNAKMGLTRMAQHRQKLESAVSTATAEAVSEARRSGSFDLARRHAPDILACRRDVALMDVVQSAFKQVIPNLALIASSRRCPPELAVATGVIVWSADRLQIPEFGIVRDQILARFGSSKAAVAKMQASSLGGITIPSQVVEAYTGSPGSDPQAVQSWIAEIAKSAGVPVPPPPPAFPVVPTQAPAPAASAAVSPPTVPKVPPPVDEQLLSAGDTDHQPQPLGSSLPLTTKKSGDGPALTVDGTPSQAKGNVSPAPAAHSEASHAPPVKGAMSPVPGQLKPSASASGLQPPSEKRPLGLTGKSSFLDMIAKLTTGSGAGGSAAASELAEAFTSATDVEATALPMKMEPTSLTFGLGSRQAPVDEDITEELNFANMTRSTCHFALRQANVAETEGKCAVTFEPAHGQVSSGKTATIAAKLHVFCTTRFALEIHVVMWGSDAKQAVCAVMRSQHESQLTTKLDDAELKRGDTIGDGAYGVVYRGEYRGLAVAIKVLKHQEDLTAEMLADFTAEARMMEKLRHPAILSFVGAVHARGHLALVTELCPYGSLLSAMRKKKFSDELKVKCLTDCASGMNFLHQSGIMHRDLKPDNLLIVSLEPKSSVCCKLSDFGTTRDVNRFASDMQSTRGIGTPMFMAPEVLNGDTYDRSADVYAFALIINIIFAEALPFADENIVGRPWEFAAAVRGGKRPKTPENIVPECAELMVRSWAQKPSDRPSFDQIHQYMLKVLAKYNESP